MQVKSQKCHLKVGSTLTQTIENLNLINTMQTYFLESIKLLKINVKNKSPSVNNEDCRLLGCTCAKKAGTQ